MATCLMRPPCALDCRQPDALRTANFSPCALDVPSPKATRGAPPSVNASATGLVQQLPSMTSCSDQLSASHGPLLKRSLESLVRNASERVPPFARSDGCEAPPM
jgi:hypothetical protein